MFSRFHRIPERNGRTDGRTDKRTELLYQNTNTTTRDTDLKVIETTVVSAVLNGKRLETYRHQVVERIVNIIEADISRSIVIWIVRRCDRRRYFPKVLFAAI